MSPLTSLAASAAGFAVLSRIVESVLFQPTPGVQLTPSQLGIVAQEVSIETADGTTIHAFELPPQAGPEPILVSPPRAILFLHGNAGNASHRLPNAAELARLGAHVLLLDYRGYGRSAGRPTIEGVLLDAEAGLDTLRRSGFPEHRIVIFGRSLGGALALQIARGRQLGGVIVESTFSSLADEARSVVGFPGAWIAGDALDSVDAVSELRAPLLSIHGDRDTIVPFALGRKLYEAAPEPKRFETIVGAGHNDTVLVGGSVYFGWIRDFLEETTPRE